MTTTQIDIEAVKKLLLLLENDMEGMGWDVQPRLYAVSGTPDDPRFDLLAMINGHPFEAIRDMHKEGRRVPSQVLGLALANEGWRHLSLEEAIAIDPERFEEGMQKVKEMWRADMGEEIPDDKLMDIANKAHQEVVTSVRPSQLPEQMRVEVRNTMAVFRDGTSLTVMRDRGKEPTFLNPQEKKFTLQGRVPSAMHNFLNGTWDPEDDD